MQLTRVINVFDKEDLTKIRLNLLYFCTKLHNIVK